MLELRFDIGQVFDVRHPLDNDFHANGTTGSIGLAPGERMVTSIMVPSINTAEISASLGDDNFITIVPASGFTGLTYVDYTVEHFEGETRTARIFVRVI
ncbi:MAG: hypothetical protein AAF251_01625 [Pseudomonadota bacterium]